LAPRFHHEAKKQKEEIRRGILYDSVYSSIHLVATIATGATIATTVLAVTTLSLVATVLAVTALSLVATITIASTTRFHFYILL
jgi:hypothetical protein